MINIINSSELVIFFKFTGFLISSGLVGWLLKLLWKKIDTWITNINKAVDKIKALEDDVENQYKLVDAKLKEGSDRFDKLERENNKTNTKLMEMVSEAAIEMAEARVQFMKDFVSEVNFKPKVVEIANNYCRENCRKKS